MKDLVAWAVESLTTVCKTMSRKRCVDSFYMIVQAMQHTAERKEHITCSVRQAFFTFANGVTEPCISPTSDHAVLNHYLRQVR